MSTAPIRVVLDCDTANEIDDQFAIAYALGSPALDVRGVISVQNTLIHGAGSVERYQEEAERVVALCGKGTVCRVCAARLARWRRAQRPCRARGWTS